MIFHKQLRERSAAQHLLNHTGSVPSGGRERLAQPQTAPQPIAQQGSRDVNIR